MKLNNLETICLALAKDKGPESTATLRSMINENKHLITDEESFFNPIAEALSASIEVDKSYTDAVTRESTEKIAHLIGLLPKISNVEALIKNLAQVNCSAANVVIMMMCNRKETQEISRNYLTSHLESFIENKNLVEMVTKFSNFSNDKLLELGNSLEKLDNDFNDQTDDYGAYIRKRESYLKLILELLESMPDPRVNNKFLEQVFNIESTMGQGERIIDCLQQRNLFEKSSIDKKSFASYLITKRSTLELERIFDWKDDIIKIEDYKEIANIADLVEIAVYSNEYNADWQNLLSRLKDDIGKNNTLGVCRPEDVIYICTVFKVHKKKDISMEQADDIMTVIDSVDEENLPMANYYENYLINLLTKCSLSAPIVDVITSILLEHDIDMSYDLETAQGTKKLEYCLATCNNQNILKAFLKEEHQSNTITGQGPRINTSALYFKAGSIAIGLYEFEQLELLSPEEYHQFTQTGSYEIPMDQREDYYDNLTQIVESIVNMATDNETKKTLLRKVLLDARVRLVNIEIIDIIAPVFQEDELVNLVDELLISNQVFFMNPQKDEVTGETICFEIALKEEVEERILSHIKHVHQKSKRN